MFSLILHTFTIQSINARFIVHIEDSGFMPVSQISGSADSLDLKDLLKSSQMLSSSVEENPGLPSIIQECVIDAPVKKLKWLGLDIVDTTQKKEECSDVELVCSSMHSLLSSAGASIVCEEDQKLYTAEKSLRGNEPNDPLYASKQWGVQRLGLPSVWSSEMGSSDVTVAVIDTGIDPEHEDLKGQIWRNTAEIPNNGIDDDGNGYVDDVYGWDFMNGDNVPDDETDHGTHCAGIIAAKINNRKGIAGIAPGVKVMPLKILGRRGGDLSAMLEALNYALSFGVKISSNSLGGTLNPQKIRTLSSALRKAEEQGHLFVVAAGNSRTNIDQKDSYGSKSDMMYPCGFSTTHNNVVCVSSISRNDQFSWFSNFGAESVQIAAPGSDITSSVKHNRYISKSGTSQATPMVAATAALMLSAHPSVTAREMRCVLMRTGERLPILATKVSSGKLVNVKAAIEGVERCGCK